MCENCNCKENREKELQGILDKYTTDKSNLIQILNEVQEHYGYIPKFAQLEISQYLDISRSRNLWSYNLLFKIYSKAKR